MKHLSLIIGSENDPQSICTSTGKALLLASHTLEQVDCQVTFKNDEWEDFDYVKLFFEAIEPGETSGIVKEVTLIENSCKIPWQVLVKQARVKVNAVGYKLATYAGSGESVISNRLTTYKILSINVKQTVNIEESMHDGNIASLISGSNIISVNGKTGTIILTPEDVGADPAGSSAIVQTIVDAHIANSSNPHSVTKEQIGLGNVDNVKQYSDINPPPYPVYSVNTKTGAVMLKTSDLENDSDYITNSVSDLVNYYLKTDVYTKDEVTDIVNSLIETSVENAITEKTTSLLDELIEKIENGEVEVPGASASLSDEVRAMLYGRTENEIIDTLPEIIDYVKNRQDTGMDETLTYDEIIEIIGEVTGGIIFPESSEANTLLYGTTDDDIINTLPEIIEYIKNRKETGMDDTLSADDILDILGTLGSDFELPETSSLLYGRTDDNIVNTIPEIIDYIQHRKDEGMDDTLSADDILDILGVSDTGIIASPETTNLLYGKSDDNIVNTLPEVFDYIKAKQEAGEPIEMSADELLALLYQ